jgi:hypothetical protein
MRTKLVSCNTVEGVVAAIGMMSLHVELLLYAGARSAPPVKLQL